MSIDELPGRAAVRISTRATIVVLLGCNGGRLVYRGETRGPTPLEPAIGALAPTRSLATRSGAGHVAADEWFPVPRTSTLCAALNG